MGKVRSGPDRAEKRGKTAGARLGLLGGTFDPVHLGHLTVARRALDALALHRILFIPALCPPHKTAVQVTPFRHRLAMLALALRDQPDCAVSLVEAKRPGPSYTIDTLTELHLELGPETVFFFLIGMDAFLDIPTWKQWERLVKSANFVVVGRPSLDRDRIAALVERRWPGYAFSPEAAGWIGTSGNGIFCLPMEPVPISSTQVRQRVGAGCSAHGLVPPLVAEYIETHGLYRAKGP